MVTISKTPQSANLREYCGWTGNTEDDIVTTGTIYHDTASKGYSKSGKRVFKARLAVLQYDFDGNFIAEYPSSKEASEAAGVDRSLISKCCRGQRRTAGGFVWKYKE